MATTPQTKTYLFACLCVPESRSHAWANPDKKICGLEEPTKEGFESQKVSNFLFGIEELSHFLDKAHHDNWQFFLVQNSLPWHTMCMHFHIPDDDKERAYWPLSIGQVSLIVERKSVFCLSVCVIEHSSFWSKQALILYGVLLHWEGFAALQ